MSPLRQVLAEIVASPGERSLNDIAQRLDLSRDEVEAMVEYWVSRGRLTVDQIGGGCPPGGCGGCGVAGQPGCASGGSSPLRGAGGPVLVTISAPPRDNR